MAGKSSGGPSASCWAISRALASAWPFGTTWLARPQCLASAASIQRPVIRNSIATRSAGSSRNAVNTAFSRRLAARSMAFAFGRSIVTSKSAPRVAVLMPSIAVVSDMSGLLVQADQGVDCHGAAPRREHDHGIQVELDEALEVRGSVSRGGERGLDERRDIAR